MKYSRFLKMNVFTPLGMGHVLVDKSVEPAELTVARYGEDRSRLSETHPIPHSSRAIHASAHDLIRYAQFHLKSLPSDKQQILTEAILEKMHHENLTSSNQSWRSDGEVLISEMASFGYSLRDEMVELKLLSHSFPQKALQ